MSAENAGSGMRRIGLYRHSSGKWMSNQSVTGSLRPFVCLAGAVL